MVDKIKVGQKIYALRKRMGITQDGLSRMVNVTPQAISKWENGIALPDTGLLPVLADIFHIQIEELLCMDSGNHSGISSSQADRVLLPNLTYAPGSPSVIGCIRSCLQYLGFHVSPGWISAPYAFMLNINEEVSFMGPEFWHDYGFIHELIRDCGGTIESYYGSKNDADILQKRTIAWKKIRDAIDKGLPCYAWEMDHPLFYLVAGYDDIGYYYIEPDSMRILGPKAYSELGKSEWGILEIHIMRPGNISDNLKTLKNVFEYATNIGNSDIIKPNKGYTMGPEAYSVWSEAIRTGSADYYGLSYNASFWASCKRNAVLFLQEGKMRIGILEDMFDRAIANYEIAANALSRLANLYPMNGVSGVNNAKQVSEESIKLLSTAKRAECKGLAKITEILSYIYSIW